MGKRIVKRLAVVAMLVCFLANGIVVNAAERTVAQGDYLKKIAVEVYGDEAKWELIYEANKDQIKNPNLIYAGQVLTIPDAESAEVGAVPEEAVTEETIPEETVPEQEEPVAVPVVNKEADFEKYGLTGNMAEQGVAYDYVMQCYIEPSLTTTAKAVFSNYRTFTSADGFPAKDGYEWKSVDVTVIMGDDNANYYGGIISTCNEDYYDIVGHDASSVRDDDGTMHYTVNYNGIDYTDCLSKPLSGQWTYWADEKYEALGWWDYSVFYGTMSMRVPVGYDGFVLGLRNGAIEWGEGKYVFDLDNTTTLFFRFK